MGGRRAATVIAAAVLAGVSAGFAISIVHSHSQTSLGGGGPWSAVLQVVAVAVLAAVGTAGLFARDGCTTSALMLASAATMWLAMPPAEYLTNDVWFTAALATTGASGLLLVCVVLRWPAPPRSPTRAVAILALVPILLSGLLPTLLFAPRAAGCAGCARNLIGAGSAPGVRDALLTAGEVAVVVWCALAMCVLIFRLVRLPRTARPIVAPVLAAGLGIALACAYSATHELTLPTVEIDRDVQASWLVVCALATAVALWIAASSLAYRRAARTLTRRVLDANPAPDTLRDAYADLIGDPDLQLVLNPKQSGDAAGALRVVRAGDTLAEIRFRPNFTDAAPRLRAAVRATALALEYAAAQDALTRDQAVLVESRQRIVNTGDKARYRIERNLHDGGQQRLVALALQVLALERRCAAPDTAAQLADTRTELSAALDELRSIAHGLFPRALHDDGLSRALLEFRDHSPIAVAIRIGQLPDRLPDALAMAAYRLVTDLAHGLPECTHALRVEVNRAGGQLRIDVAATGPDADALWAASRHARDRIEALAGTVSVIATNDGHAVRGVLPCAR